MTSPKLPSTPHEVLPDESADDDTSVPLMDDQHFRDFLGGGGYETTDSFVRTFQRAAAEMNRRLARGQAKLLKAQNVRLEAQEELNKAQLEAALTAAGVNHLIETYPAKHGWVLRDLPVYDAACEERHWDTITKFFNATLTT